MTTSPFARLRVAFLGSGSAGNATAVCLGEDCVLVDCGFSARETVRRLEACGIPRTSVRTLLLTHEHGDHVRGAEVLTRRLDITLLATEGTLRATGLAARAAGRVRAGEDATICGMRVRAFATSHDVAEPVGFTFSSPCGGTFGLATDTGTLAGEVTEALSECEWVGLEANHDSGMLECGPYPAFLKRRIASPRGHLSNSSAADALACLASGRTRRVIALHLSRTNNTPSVALTALKQRAEELALPLSIGAVGQDTPRVQESVA